MSSAYYASGRSQHSQYQQQQPQYQQQQPQYQQQPPPQLPQLHGRLLAQYQEGIADPDEIVTDAPTEQFRLGYLDVTCLILNRIIGTGIFNSPSRVVKGTNNVGASLFFGPPASFTACPARTCTSSDLNYLQYVYRKPRYKKDTVLYFGCLYGISFICLGNMAGNCISFAVRALQAANPGTAPEDFSSRSVRGIAIAVATATCFIHTISRRGGIFINNVLALIKVGMLLLIITTAIAVAAGGFHARDGSEVPNYISYNTGRGSSFKSVSDLGSGEANGYAQAFLSIVFAFSGFDQPNYVLGEIKSPRKTFPGE
ncbi:unnamed protein product [Parascedosporium putredinis]|uniref:Uncharacterized protein n=1 Tax=Parascedosporium putredinis TaxID=1442378 RepID=A0A9P1GZT8_9PEZI|nr:unnamed protein product [Parascedosporium putredinis]CAI7992168.1 unnamed protein product [Parascedosporium putredinis]